MTISVSNREAAITALTDKTGLAIDGSNPIPVSIIGGGDASAANQSLQITQETLINTKLDTILSKLNPAQVRDSTTAALGAGATWTSAVFDSNNGMSWLTFSALSVTAMIIYVDESVDGSNWSQIDSISILAGISNYANHKLSGRYGRFRVVNGTVANAGGIANLIIMAAQGVDNSDFNSTLVDINNVHIGSYSYSHINTAGTTVLKSNAGIFHCISCNSFVNGSTVTVYDTGSVICVIAPPNNSVPFRLQFDAIFKVGLTVVITGTSDWTVMYN